MCGGFIKKVQHKSKCCNCTMTFNIFLPPISKAPVLYYLAGVRSTEDKGPQKSDFARYASKHSLVVVFPDTSPRNLTFPEVEENKDWRLGYSAGHYCDATNQPWSENFNMFTYVTQELPALIKLSFDVSPSKQSIMGHSMGGNGALVAACRSEYLSVSALAPICSPATSPYCELAIEKYFGGDVTLFKPFSIAHLDGELPPALVDCGTSDEWMEWLEPQKLNKEVTWRW